jgi:nucleoside phosphorylase
VRASLLTSSMTIGELRSRLIHDYPAAPDRTSFLQDASDLLVDLCSSMKASASTNRQQSKIADQLYMLALELRSRTDDFVTSIEPDEARARKPVEEAWIALLDGLKKLEVLTGPIVVSSYLKQKPSVTSGSASLDAKVDIVVITMREDETSAVLKRLAGNENLPCRNRTYAIRQLKRKDGDFVSLASIRTPGQGLLPAMQTASNAIEDLNPTWLALVGICGAVPDSEFTLGDVIVASHLHAFTLGALKEDQPPHFSDFGGPMSRKSEDLVALITSLDKELSGWQSDESTGTPRPAVYLAPDKFYGSVEWRRRTEEILAAHFNVPSSRTQPVVTTRPVASSDFLVKDTETLLGWQNSARHLGGIEMELAGVYHAARRREKEYPILAVRGISDIVGFKRSDEWTRYAAETAAAFFAALVQAMPRHFLWSGQRSKATPQ